MPVRLLTNFIGPHGELHEAGEILPDDFDADLCQSLVDSGGAEKVTVKKEKP